MPITLVVDDLDETIRLSSPEGVEITDEMRDLMTKLLDPEVPKHTLTFHERKVGLFYGWLP